MAIDTELASAELRRLAEALTRSGVPTGKHAVELHDLARLIYTTPLLSQVLNELLSEEARDLPLALQQWGDGRAAGARKELAALNELATGLWVESAKALLAARVAGGAGLEAAQSIDELIARAKESAGGNMVVGGSGIRAPAIRWSIGAADIETLRSARDAVPLLAGICRTLERQKICVSTAAMTLAATVRASEVMDELLTDYDLSKEALTLLPLKKSADDLRSFYRAMEHRLDGRHDPASDLHLSVAISPLLQNGGLPRLLDALQARLASGPVRRHVLSRLVAYFEHFGRLRVLSLLAAEQQKKPARIEDVLQPEMDSFLFHEGLFPMTHFSAGGGRVDSLLPADRALAERARAAHAVPTLIEAKQVINPETTDKRIAAALREAHAQAEQYLNTIRSAHDLRSAVAIAVVFYAGKTRYHLPNDVADNALLIYCGLESPSNSSELLPVGKDWNLLGS